MSFLRAAALAVMIPTVAAAQGPGPFKYPETRRGDTVETLELASAADAGTATDLYALAADLRTRAVDTWGLAAVQLDLRATAGGQGHVHVFLPVHPTDSLDGGLDTGHSGTGHDGHDH